MSDSKDAALPAVTAQVLFDQGNAGFGAGDWERYLAILRRHAAVLHVPVRTVERTLFLCHRRFQVGRVYDRAARR